MADRKPPNEWRALWDAISLAAFALVLVLCMLDWDAVLAYGWGV